MIKFKFKVGDKVHCAFSSLAGSYEIISKQLIYKGLPCYKFEGYKYSICPEKFLTLVENGGN